MARKKSDKKQIEDYRHSEAKRKNNPPAKIAAEGVVPLLPKAKYAYSLRLSPVLRFDPTGLPDKIVELVHEVQRRLLTSDEKDLLLDAYYAKLYGLTEEELRYILDPKDVYGDDFPSESFRVLKEKETRLYGEYRAKRLILEA